MRLLPVLLFLWSAASPSLGALPSKSHAIPHCVRVLLPPDAAPSWPLLALFAALQLGRLWVIATLGRRWTTRVMVRPTVAETGP